MNIKIKKNEQDDTKDKVVDDEQMSAADARRRTEHEAPHDWDQQAPTGGLGEAQAFSKF